MRRRSIALIAAHADGDNARAGSIAAHADGGSARAGSIAAHTDRGSVRAGSIAAPRCMPEASQHVGGQDHADLAWGGGEEKTAHSRRDFPGSSRRINCVIQLMLDDLRVIRAACRRPCAICDRPRSECWWWRGWGRGRRSRGGEWAWMRLSVRH